MGTDALILAGTNIRPYEAVLRISEMLSLRKIQREVPMTKPSSKQVL